MRFAEVVTVSRSVAATAARLEKTAHLAGLLARTPADETAIIVAFLTGEPRQGRIGVGGALLSSMRDVTPAVEASLEVSEVDAVLERVADTSGAGSTAGHAQLLRDLFRRATSDSPI